ncbi:hypothetical protein Lal_00039369 [Lupinus albus]|nr:hypothetical protein Lal_00039369 [Lupinus albus]
MFPLPLYLLPLPKSDPLEFPTEVDPLKPLPRVLLLPGKSFSESETTKLTNQCQLINPITRILKIACRNVGLDDFACSGGTTVLNPNNVLQRRQTHEIVMWDRRTGGINASTVSRLHQSKVNSNSIPIVGGSSDAPESQSTASTMLHRNARGSRSDIAWKHGNVVDGTRKIQCKYCQKIVSGGTYRSKHHLPRTNKDVEPCILVSGELKEKMLLIVAALQQNLIKKSNSFFSEEEQPKVVEKRKEIENLFKRKGIST